MTRTLYLNADGKWRWSHCRRNHEFTPDNTYTDPKGVRQCRACRRLGHLVRVQPRYELTCPDCGETRVLRYKPKRTKRFAPEVCGACANRRLPQCQPRPKPAPVVKAVADWRTEEERMPPMAWARKTLREQPDIRAALRWLPTMEEAA